MANVGKGHIERLPSGSYRVRVYAGNDPLTGKEIRLKATAKTAEHAHAELARLLEQASTGQQPESAATVGYLLDQYMAVADLDVSTREGYEGYIRRTIKPALGGMELRKLRGPVLDTFYARLRRCGDLACTGRPSPSTAMCRFSQSTQEIPVPHTGRSPTRWPRRSAPGSSGRENGCRRYAR